MNIVHVSLICIEELGYGCECLLTACVLTISAEEPTMGNLKARRLSDPKLLCDALVINAQEESRST